MHARGRLAVLGAAVLLMTSGCGNPGGSVATTVSGNCALMREKYTLSPVSAHRLEAALGAGAYTLEGDVSSDDRTDSTRAFPLDGECNYFDKDHVRRLSVSISQKGLPGSSFDQARHTQQTDPRARKIDGTDGYVMTEDLTDHDGSTATKAVATVFEEDRIVIANILVPAKDVDSGHQAAAIAKEALAVFDKRMKGAS